MPKIEETFRPSEVKRVAFHTFGCKLNQSETSTIAHQFDEHGYEIVDIDDPADLYVINTCTVTHKADSKARSQIRRALRISPEAFVAVVGCYAEHNPDEIASIDGVDLILGAEEKFKLLDMLSNESKGENVWQKNPTPEVMLACDAGDYRSMESVPTLEMEGKTRIFLKIQDGCDYNCSFCIIPSVRGSGRSLPLSQVVDQAQQIAENGYKEIVLTGVNTGTYLDDDGNQLIDVLDRLSTLPGLERIRLSSVEPDRMTDDMLQLIAERPKICMHLHLPLQNGSDRILKKMRRRYQTKRYRDVVERAFALMPNAGLGADVMVGFPGETDDDFAETCELIESLPFSYLHVFTYSQRMGTDAADMENQVDPQTHQRRSFVLRQLSKRKRREFLDKQVGTVRDVLLEPGDGETYLDGWTGNYARVRIPYQPELINELLPVQLTERDGDYLKGNVIREQVEAA
ncbi:MAG: tRNA (N(6)-L-threonylcarbamoyladenosine(37)-C(2))-methylthiotransferase MtaB [Candidatus Marinimicrobia bacterium]|nr:tRNA (N(6)-L-threonylcarbamoyladenosine(37)-C(2))-methylthiotransferase MtaB [Candidatus Neomarinimicrobiota bacterium]MCF7827676.1 tRNA (N(6)-L-threonylcarbamoyladenosine(37)-C(2))-methylthiotransferase MtaB [Candidatus Neomarinimicrobiota bacterium]MCF7881269.1 tRNA (N(6)-L-threonylcarbamoyladenosine(37)-C(2))-methylthiotransferase MtaB [Candidatus Neomarinimicrobiota bacterium]